jgi:glucan phosphoethanolaminetransferase (alkaline phosphatase superfamily)
VESPAELQRVGPPDTVSSVRPRLPLWQRFQQWVLLLIVGNLLALRLVVFTTARSELGLGGLGSLSLVDAGWALVALLLLVQSLSLEFLVLRGVEWALGRPFLRWPARLLLFVFLVGEMAATKAFRMVHGYSRGFQLLHVPAGETGSVISGVAEPWLLAATAFVAIPALFVVAIPAEALSRRVRVALRVTTVLAVGAVTAQLAFPAALSTAAYSPWLLTVEREQPNRIPRVSASEPAPEDWAPATQLAPLWKGLQGQERDFSVVVVVLESLRAETFWPSASAPSMPRLAARSAEAAVFTRAYAHEPWSLKGLEALLFGIYPSPFYESFVGPRRGVALASAASRWGDLGLRTGFFGHGEVPVIGEGPFLRAHGFATVPDGAELRQLDPHPTDRTLVTALTRFLDAAPGERFGAFLWPHGTHLPYAVAGSATPPATLAAYRESVTALDGLLGEIFDALETRGRTENTVVVLVGDHGESFGEHPASGLGHGAWLFEETAHIPLVLLNARLFHGERDARIVQQKDVAATVAWLAGDPRPQLNHGSTLFHQRSSESAYLVNRYDASNLRGGLVRGNHGFIIGRATLRDVPPGKVFDLSNDPKETHDLGLREPERLQALRSRYFGWLETWTERWMVLEESGAWDDPAAVARALHLPEAARLRAPVKPAATGR